VDIEFNGRLRFRFRVGLTLVGAGPVGPAGTRNARSRR
jgi:hypothetical protein